MASDLNRRSFINGELLEQQFLQCPVCIEKFNLQERAPKLLPCNHNVCLACLIQLVDKSPPYHRQKLVKCPTCRKEKLLGNAKDMPNDHKVVQMFDILDKRNGMQICMCTKHDEELKFFCQVCVLPICRNCTVLDHKEPWGHKVINITDAYENFREIFDQLESRVEHHIVETRTRLPFIDSYPAKVKTCEIELQQKIKEKFEKLHHELQKREDTLVKELDDTVWQSTSQARTKYDTLTQHNQQLQNLLEEFRSTRDNRDKSEVFTAFKNLKIHLERYAFKMYTSGAVPTLEFEERALLLEIRRLGEVKTSNYTCTVL